MPESLRILVTVNFFGTVFSKVLKIRFNKEQFLSVIDEKFR